MSLPDRNNPYSFDAFVGKRDAFDYYVDDAFLQRLVRYHGGESWQEIDAAARDFSRKASFRWRGLADAAARPENRPSVLHYDAYRRRIDRLARPLETVLMEREIFAEGLFSPRVNPWERLMKLFLVYQNGEACIACPLVCTEGLVALLEAFADSPETHAILHHCRDGRDGDYAIGAQYLTEMQGGSDIPANLLEAVREGAHWRLFGTKFFCSATHADYAVVTAKPQGSEQIGIFVVPSWLPGMKEQERRNGFTIDRLKWKMGTVELPTAEITFDGALAYSVGPLERGLANVVGIVLTHSRLTIGLSGAASMTRAAREARQYAAFREAFGRSIELFPMVDSQLVVLDRCARRSTAAAFKIYGQFLALDGRNRVGVHAGDPPDVRQRRFDVRELVMLQKITASWDAVEQLRLAMSIFGGHGVMEDFSALPRLYRDAAVNELWEGPRNVLLHQLHRDLQQAKPWYGPSRFVRSLLAHGEQRRVREFEEELDELLAYADLALPSEAAGHVCRRWDGFCHRLCHAYQDLALEELEAAF